MDFKNSSLKEPKVIIKACWREEASHTLSPIKQEFQDQESTAEQVEPTMDSSQMLAAEPILRDHVLLEAATMEEVERVDQAKGLETQNEINKRVFFK